MSPSAIRRTARRARQVSPLLQIGRLPVEALLILRPRREALLTRVDRLRQAARDVLPLLRVGGQVVGLEAVAGGVVDQLAVAVAQAEGVFGPRGEEVGP